MITNSHHHAGRGCGCACANGGCCSGKAKGRERLLGALRQTRVDRPPVWMMRQAGRHLPKYRALRETLSFLDLCRDEEANAIASAEPLQRYGLDAAIVFNDILTPLGDMGMKLDFQPGPRFERLITSVADAGALTTPAYGPDSDVSRCVSALRRTVGEKSAVLGFIGAPLTVAAFAIAGSGTQRAADLRTDAQTRRDVYVAMQERLLPVLTDYAAAQVAAGADVIQIFESLAHDVDEAIYRQVGLPFMERIIGQVRRVAPQTPVIAFGRGIWPYLVNMGRAGAAAISVDETRPLAEARSTLRASGLRTALQGNLRPEALLGSPDEAFAEAALLLRRWRSIVPNPESAETLGPTGWVFNLGHGVPADADPETVQAVVDAVKDFAALTTPGRLRPTQGVTP